MCRQGHHPHSDCTNFPNPKTKNNPKVQEREMFSEANERFNKTDVVADTVTKMISMEPVAAM